MTIHTAEPRAKRWTRDEFYELAERGYFHGKRVQLIEGEIFEMAPQGHPHSWALTRLNRWATSHYPPPALIRIQMPLNATAHSDPEPDVAVIPDPALAAKDHPEIAELIVEVSDSSLSLDRRKIAIYATCGVPEYWIVNINAAQVEVYRNPLRMERRYADESIVRPPQTIAPAARPDAQLPTVELFV